MRIRLSLPRVLGPALVLLAAACDVSVTNPGPVPDDELNSPLAYNALVTGARLALARAYGSDAGSGGVVAYWGAAVSFEVNPAGSTGSFGIPPLVQVGTLNADNSSGDWASANEARFVAEDALRRFAAVEAADPSKAASALQKANAALYAGYANRLLGENFCGAVLPVVGTGGTVTPGDSTAHTDYFTRAEGYFTTAIQQATAAGNATLLQAAYAGRASVRAQLATWGVGNWSDATGDAGQVDDTLVFRLPYSSQEQSQYNYVYWASANSPYRAHTQWGTFLELYYRGSGKLDTRARWDTTALLGDAAVAKFGGHVAWWPQRKYDARDDGINLSSGWEARLIEAEAALVNNTAATAVDILNARRANVNAALPQYDNTVTVDSAWTLLKIERAIELWLEARRLGDLRRWIVNGVPGNYPDGLYQDTDADGVNDTRTETMTTPVARSLCFPIGENEHDTNPNIP